MSRFLLTVVSCFAIVTLAKGSIQIDDPELDARIKALAQQLRCLVCQNETIADSHADLAVDLRKQIGEQVKAGRTDREVITFLTDRYGDFILYNPPVQPRTWLLWFGPFMLLAGSLFTLYRFLKRWPTIVKHRPLSATDRKRAEELLGRAARPFIAGGVTESNLVLYREQFAALAFDLANGTIERAQCDQDREELMRRLLDDLSLQSTACPIRLTAEDSRNLNIALAVVVPLLAIVLYVSLGSPSALSQAAAPAAIPSTGVSSDRMQIQRVLQLDPSNPGALALAGNLAFEVGDYRRAIIYWERLQHVLPPGSEVEQPLAQRIREARVLADGKGNR